MTRRILLIIIAAVALCIMVGALWFWFFSGGAPAPSGTGSFGSAQNKPGGTTGAGQGDQTNIPSGVNSAGSGANASAGGGSSLGGPGGVGGGSAFTFGSTTGVNGISGVDAVPGVDWVGGTDSGGVGGGATTNFVPKTANQLNTDGISGTPQLALTPGSVANSAAGGSGLGLAIGGILGSAAGCALIPLWQSMSEGLGTADSAKPTPLALAGGFVFVYDVAAYQKNSAGQINKGFKDTWDCLARTVGRAIIQQMTNSIVNWINGGFNGKPSFVTNFQQFFQNVGDQAAGEFIRGTALSFLCSPFQLKIRIAIAQSYARGGGGQACTLTGIVKNVNSFLTGSFGQGGWAGLIQLTTIPTNNPYGAYAYAQIGLATAQNNAINNANRNITPSGFISLQKCDPPGSTDPKNCKVQTPGKLIENAIVTTENQGYLSNQLAQSFDQIVSALLNQLMTKTLYNGLSTLSGQNGIAADYLTPEQQAAQATAQAMMQDMQARQQVAQQYGSVEQGAISDIQNTQQQLEGLATCYSGKNSNTLASSTEVVLHSFDPQIDYYNAQITRANAAIATLQTLETQTLNVATPADVNAAQAAYQQAINNGQLITQGEVTNAQQDRTTLQSNLASRNQTTAANLTNCNAM